MTMTPGTTRQHTRTKPRTVIQHRGVAWRFTWCTKQALISYLMHGMRPPQIARHITEQSQGKVRVSHSMVQRAITALMVDDCRQILLQGDWKPASFEIAPVPMQAPVDVLGVLTTVLDDALEIREYLRTDHGQAIPWKTRVGIMFDTIEARLDWADSFVKNRAKLLELVSFDTWLNEMLAIIDEATICTGCGLDLHLKDRIRDRIYQKLMGSGRPTPPPTTIESTAEHATADPAVPRVSASSASEP